MALWRPIKSNCRIWSLFMQMRYGGKQLYRPSFVGWWRHSMWSPDHVRIFEYSPVHGCQLGLKTPPPLFVGHVRELVGVVIEETVIIDGHKRVERLDLMPYLRSQL